MSGLTLLPDPVWRERAACLGMDTGLFFPDPLWGRGSHSQSVGQVREAKKVCSVCSVVEDCLTTAMVLNEPEGVWGGLSSRERKRLRRVWREEGRLA